MKFILSRVNDSATHSKKWVIGYAALFWVITKIIASVICGICIAVYLQSYGCNPQEMTAFGGNPTKAASVASLIWKLALVGLLAPVIEEFIFRLGLSFKKIQVALAISGIPIFVWWSRMSIWPWWFAAIAVAIALIIFFCIMRFSDQNFWTSLKERYMVTAMWVTSIAFGLVHLVAFTLLDAFLFPYAICVILAPFFAGCACAYLRVNLGFKWGVAMHIFNNIPGIVMTIVLYLS